MRRPLPDNTQHSQAADIHALECVATVTGRDSIYINKYWGHKTSLSSQQPIPVMYSSW